MTGYIVNWVNQDIELPELGTAGYNDLADKQSGNRLFADEASAMAECAYRRAQGADTEVTLSDDTSCTTVEYFGK